MARCSAGGKGRVDTTVVGAGFGVRVPGVTGAGLTGAEVTVADGVGTTREGEGPVGVGAGLGVPTGAAVPVSSEALNGAGSWDSEHADSELTSATTTSTGTART